MSNTIFEYKRKSFMEIGELFFWTASIHKWLCLLGMDEYKRIIVDSLKHLSEAGKIDIFAFVIMPNHIHLIWKINSKNGKETAQSSFLKFTAHEFRKRLIQTSPQSLIEYSVSASNKSHEFWQRDSMAIHLYNKEIAYQKLDYIHTNPLQEHWGLAKDPSNYIYLSASYYEKGITDYLFLKDLREEFCWSFGS